MGSSGRTSNKKLKRAKRRVAKHVLTESSPAPFVDKGAGDEGAEDLIELIQRERNRSMPILPALDPAHEKLWRTVLEMREASRSGLIEFTQDEKYFLFQIANRDNCALFETARQIAVLYEFRKVFAIYWKSAKSNRKF